MMKPRWFFPTCLLALTLCAWTSAVADRAWTGLGDGKNWFNTNNWIPNDNYPLAGENVVISNSASVVLSNSTALLGDFVITNATLTFTNWTTALNATNVSIQSNGVLTLPPCFTNNQMSNRVYVVCSNFTILEGGRIDVNGKGFGQTTSNGAGPGPGGGNYDGGGESSGGGYGGRGGCSQLAAAGGSPCGAANAPLAPGSGGGSYPGSTNDYGRGGAGGGVVWIEAGGTATVHGAIMANGTNGTVRAGSGSGGGVYITCWTFAGSNGTISANGANAPGTKAGGGGGGRIAVVYTNVAANTRVSFSTSPGTGYGESQTNRLWWTYVAGMGTLYFLDKSLLSETLDSRFADVRVIIPDFTAWNVDHLTVSNAVLALGDTNTTFQLTVTNDLVLRNGAELTLCGAPLKKGAISFGGSAGSGTTNPAVTVGSNVVLNGGALVLGGGPPTAAGQTQQSKPALNVGGALTLTNAGCLYVYGGVTNAAGTYGALVSVTGDVDIASSSWIYPISNPSNGGSATFRMNNLGVATNGGFNADARGFSPDYGPGKGISPNSGGGGGYGGTGGRGIHDTAYGGSPYGVSNAPVNPGSGGGSYQISVNNSRGFGGGSIWMEAKGSVSLNGLMTAAGEDDPTKYGAGSGGGIYVTCASFTGSSDGALRAAGGKSVPSGGGGGQIAVWVDVSRSMRNRYLNAENVRPVARSSSCPAEFKGTISVAPGTGYLNYPPDPKGAYPGTVFFFKYVKGAQFSVH